MTSDWHDDVSPPRYLPADHVIRQMAEFGRGRIDGLNSAEVLGLGLMGGGFITLGALFAVLLASGFESEGPRVLVEGLGFSTGFFFVVLSEAALFTEANVVMPATLLAGGASAMRVIRFWALALVGNLVGALLFGWLIRVAHTYSAPVESTLADIVERRCPSAPQVDSTVGSG